MLRYGCRHGLPHDFITLHENPQRKVEKCQLCGLRKKWNKGYKGRIDNIEYLKLHIRNFCQKFGATKRCYYKIYDNKKLTIYI